MSPDRDYTRIPANAFSGQDVSSWIVVLPLGAHEQHGPHLPFETDTILACGIAQRLAARVNRNVPLTILPTEEVGYSIEHMDFDGSKTLSYDEAIERWIGVGEALANRGIRKLMLLNAHGGNSPLMTIVATELRVRFDMLCVATSWTRFIGPGEIVSEHEKAFGIHGGDIETSAMLALAPDRVSMDKAENFHSFQDQLAQTNSHLRAYGPHAFGWKIQDLNGQGVTGNASAATAEKGEKLIDQAVTGLSALIDDIHAFDLSHLK